MFGRLYGVLLPFFASFLLAWLLDPLVTFVQQKCKVKFRTLSVAITLVVFVGLLVLGFYLLVPAIGREVKSAAVAVERYFENFDPDRYFSAETQQKIQEAMNGLNLESLLSYPEVRDGIQNFLPQIHRIAIPYFPAYCLSFHTRQLAKLRTEETSAAGLNDCA